MRLRSAELGSGGRGDQPRLQQHRGQAEEQGAGDAPAEPRHGREPEGRGGILRSCARSGRQGCGLRLRPPARALAQSASHTLSRRRPQRRRGRRGRRRGKQHPRARDAGGGTNLAPGTAAPRSTRGWAAWRARTRRGAGARCDWWPPRVNGKEPFRDWQTRSSSAYRDTEILQKVE